MLSVYLMEFLGPGFNLNLKKNMEKGFAFIATLAVLQQRRKRLLGMISVCAAALVG